MCLVMCLCWTEEVTWTRLECCLLSLTIKKGNYLNTVIRYDDLGNLINMEIVRLYKLDLNRFFYVIYVCYMLIGWVVEYK